MSHGAPALVDLATINARSRPAVPIWDAGPVDVSGVADVGRGLVLAHQGGWDEALMVIVPVGLFVGLLRLAIVRAERADEAEGTAGDGWVDGDRPGRDRGEEADG